jgi:hypothetical protein
MSLLHTPLAFGGIEFRNRVRVSRMCQYSSRDGGPTEWHSVALSRLLIPLGVDPVDCSSGALSPAQQIPVGPGY